MISKLVEIVPLPHRQGNCIAITTIRWPDFSERPPFGLSIGRFFRHPDTPLLSLFPRHRFPQAALKRAGYAEAGRLR